MPGRLFPGQADNRFEGYRAELWLLGPLALGLAPSLIRARNHPRTGMEG